MQNIKQRLYSAIVTTLLCVIGISLAHTSLIFKGVYIYLYLPIVIFAFFIGFFYSYRCLPINNQSKASHPLWVGYVSFFIIFAFAVLCTLAYALLLTHDACQQLSHAHCYSSDPKTLSGLAVILGLSLLLAIPLSLIGSICAWISSWIYKKI